MSVDTIKRPMARELIARGIDLDQFERPFQGGVSPEAERAAADEEANRRRNQKRAALGYRELYARGLRVLEEPSKATPPEGNGAPAKTGRPADPREEARLACKAAMDRRMAPLWPGRPD